MKDKATGTKFDDWGIDGGTAWAHVCLNCVREHSLPEDKISRDRAPESVCGVVDCSAQSEHYYDFIPRLKKARK